MQDWMIDIPQSLIEHVKLEFDDQLVDTIINSAVLAFSNRTQFVMYYHCPYAIIFSSSVYESCLLFKGLVITTTTVTIRNNQKEASFSRTTYSGFNCS
jgi:hypothetical protein